MSRTFSGSPRPREEILSRAQGFGGESFPRFHAIGNLPLASGDARSSLIPFRAGDLVTAVHCHVGVAGATLTIAKMGIWTTAGTLLASTPNMTTEFTTTGVIAGTLSTPWTCPAEGGYYVGLVTVGTTAPQVLRGTSGITGYSAQPLSSNPGLSIGATGRTDIGNVSVVVSGNAPWVAWS